MTKFGKGIKERTFRKLKASGKIKIEPFMAVKIRRLIGELSELREYLWAKDRVMTTQEHKAILDVENTIDTLKILLSEEKEGQEDD